MASLDVRLSPHLHAPVNLWRPLSIDEHLYLVALRGDTRQVSSGTPLFTGPKRYERPPTGRLTVDSHLHAVSSGLVLAAPHSDLDRLVARRCRIQPDLC